MVWQRIMEIFLMASTVGFFIVLGKIIVLLREDREDDGAEK